MKHFLYLLISICFPIHIYSETIVIGGKTFDESQLFSTATAILLERDGVTVEKKLNITTTNLRKLQEEGKVDCYFEYFPGTALTFYPNEEISKHNWDKIKELDFHKNLIWGESANYSNGFVVITNLKGVDKISNLSNVTEKIYLPASYRYRRLDGYELLSKHYNLSNLDVKEEGHLVILGLFKKKAIRLGIVYDTDLKGMEQFATVLKDDKEFFFPYKPTPVCRSEKSFALEAMNKISSEITLDEMLGMIFNVSKSKQLIKVEAEKWLRKKGLL